MNRRLLAAAWVLTATVVGGLMAWDSIPSVGHVPDPVHIAGHLVVFAGFTAVLRPELSTGRLVLLALAAGLGLEAVQALGVGRLFPREASFDSSVNLMGASLGLLFTGPGEVRGLLRRAWVRPLLCLLVPLSAVLAGASALHALFVLLGFLALAALADSLDHPLGADLGLALVGALTVLPTSARGAFVWCLVAALLAWARPTRALRTTLVLLPLLGVP